MPLDSAKNKLTERNILTQAARNKIRESLKGLSKLNLNEKQSNLLLLAINYAVMQDQSFAIFGDEEENRTTLISRSYTQTAFQDALNQLLLLKKSQAYLNQLLGEEEKEKPAQDIPLTL